MNEIYDKMYESLKNLIKVKKCIKNLNSMTNELKTTLSENQNNVSFESIDRKTDFCFDFELSFSKISLNEKPDKCLNKINNTLNTILCPKCDFNTHSTEELEKHQLIHKNNKQFKCDFENCNKLFKRKEYLDSHKRIHSAEKLFVCNFDNCVKKFNYKRSLKRHQKSVHSEDKPLKCDFENCNKLFKRKDYLDSHKRIHS